jgi:hypothetical protein
MGPFSLVRVSPQRQDGLLAERPEPPSVLLRARGFRERGASFRAGLLLRASENVIVGSQLFAPRGLASPAGSRGFSGGIAPCTRPHVSRNSQSCDICQDHNRNRSGPTQPHCVPLFRLVVRRRRHWHIAACGLILTSVTDPRGGRWRSMSPDRQRPRNPAANAAVA